MATRDIGEGCGSYVALAVAGWAGGFGATALGYAPYFLVTFFLSFPAFLLLPWVKRTIIDAQSAADVTSAVEAARESA